MEVSLGELGRALEKMSPELVQVNRSWPDGQGAGMSNISIGTIVFCILGK